MTTKVDPRTVRVEGLGASHDVWSQIKQMLIYTHLKLWVAVARHNFKWVKITHLVSSFSLLHSYTFYTSSIH